MSVLVLTTASLALIPAMIAASGQVAWGAIALGQVIGNIGGVAVGYGWGWYGPARIAQYSATGRRTEYIESLVTRFVLALPVSAAAGAAAYLFASSMPVFAAAAAISTTWLGLTANWYFVGLARPFAMLLMETLPRAAATAVAVTLMYLGHSAIVGPLGALCGMMLGVAISTIWVMWETRRAGAEPSRLRSIKSILVSNRHGIASALGSAAYNAAPLAIVSVLAPNIQPTFAFADRVRGLVVIASAPAGTVLQGWVPRGPEVGRLRRANIALVSVCVFAIALGLGTIILAPSLVNLLGSGQIYMSWGAVLLVSACVSLNLFQLVLERAVLATFERLRVVMNAVAAGSIVGLPLVALGANNFGTAGALGGMLVGLVVSTAVEFVAYLRIARELRLRWSAP